MVLVVPVPFTLFLSVVLGVVNKAADVIDVVVLVGDVYVGFSQMTEALLF